MPGKAQHQLPLFENPQVNKDQSEIAPSCETWSGHRAQWDKSQWVPPVKKKKNIMVLLTLSVSSLYLCLPSLHVITPPGYQAHPQLLFGRKAPMYHRLIKLSKNKWK